MKPKEYIEDEEFVLGTLKDRLKEIGRKIIKFGLKDEENFLREYIELKEKFIEELKTKKEK